MGVEEDVVGLHVAVDEALRVNEIERRGDFGQPAAQARRGHGHPAPAEVARPAILQTAAGQVLEHRERRPQVLAHIEDADHVRVAQADQRLHLAREPLGELRRGGAARPRDLDDDFRPEVAVPRLVDDAHPALAELFEQVVAAAQAKARRGVALVAHGESVGSEELQNYVSCENNPKIRDYPRGQGVFVSFQPLSLTSSP